MHDNNFSNNATNTALLDSLLAHVAIIDSSGELLKTNDAWQQFDDSDAQIKRADVGKNYFTNLQLAVENGNDYALKLILGINNVLQREQDSFSHTYPLHTQTNSFWFKMTVRPCNDANTRFIMIHEDISSSMQAKYEHKKNEDRFQVKFEQSLDGIFITDAKGNILEANPMASKILGWNRKELTGFSLGSVVNIENPTYRDALKERKEHGTYSIEIDFIHKNGKLTPTETSSRIYRNPKGKLRAIITFKDISRRIEIEKNLIKTEEFTKSALNSIPGVFFVLNRDGEFIRWNENMVTNLGYTAQELSQKYVVDFIVEEQKSDVHSKIEECIEKGSLSATLKINSKDGTVRDYFIQSKRFVEDGKVYLVGSGIDVTDTKKIEQENRRHQIMLEQLFGNSPVGIAIVGTDHKIQKTNQSFEEIFGYTEEEVINKNVNELLAPENKKNEAKAISLATEKGKSLQTETIRLNKKGEEIPVLIGSVPVEVEGEVIAIYGIYVDVSTQHSYRQRIEKTLYEKEALLAELHHRVKNNLALINSLVQLQLFNSDSPELKHELTNIENRIMTIASIHEVLYQQGNLTDIPFDKFLEELLNTSSLQNMQNANNITIDTDANDLQLDISQSIPSGLLLNELLSLIFSLTNEQTKTKLHIRLREYNKKVHIIVEGLNILECSEEAQQNKSLHNILIETLVMQLNGNLIWPNPNSDYQKFELIFKKENSTSPASDILNMAS